MKQWKIGDRVKLITHAYSDSASNPVWDISKVEGTITQIRNFNTYSQNIIVNWDNGNLNYYKPDDLGGVVNKIMDVDELFGEIEL